jgi:WD40 repeat protein
VTGADKLQWQAREFDAASPLALSSDGRLAAVWLRQRGESKPALRVFNVADSKPAWDMLGDSHFQPVVVRIKPGSGDTLATIDSSGRICAWQRAIASQINVVPLKGSEKLVLEPSGDGRHLLVGVGSQPLVIHRYEFRSQSQAPHQYDGAVGRLLAVGGSSVSNRVVAVTGGDQRSDEAAIFSWKFDEIRNPTRFVTPEKASCAAVSADGRYVMFGHFDGQVSLYDVDRQESIIRFHAHDKNYGRVECLAMTPDGRFAVSGGRDALVFRYRLPILSWPQN